MKNYYSILGVQPLASHEVIKKSYRTLSKKYHPDLNPTGAEEFKNINEANSILSDPEKRKLYDIKYKEIFITNQNKKPSSQTKPKTSNGSKTNIKTNTYTNNYTNTYASKKASESTIIVNGVKINVSGASNITTNIRVVNGQIIIETINH